MMLVSHAVMDYQVKTFI